MNLFGVTHNQIFVDFVQNWFKIQNNKSAKMCHKLAKYAIRHSKNKNVT